MERALQIALSSGGRCPLGPQYSENVAQASTDAAASWRRAFLDAPYLQSALISLGLLVDTFETACTWDRFDALHNGVTGAVSAALNDVCGGGVVTCRFSHIYPDGPAPYFTFVAPSAPGKQVEHWATIKRVASDAVAAHGGTITHHHAVGRTHRPHYERERPEMLGDALRAVKRVMDPGGIMNPGCLMDP
jgi:alkyldihydroxyacetonephosphate synthase